MGRAIEDRKDISKLQMEMKEEQMKMKELQEEMIELQDVVAELSGALINTEQVDDADDEEFTPPAGKRTKTTKRKTATVA